MTTFALVSSRVCLPDSVQPAAVVVDGEQIQAIEPAENLGAGIEIRNLDDAVISPGIIDTHVHVNEPGTDWEGFESATRAASAGGVTTIVDMPLNSIPVTTNKDALRQKRETAEGKCWVDVGFHGGVVPDSVNQIGELAGEGVLGIKAFLCNSGLEEFPKVVEGVLRSVLPILKSAQIPLLVHAEIADETAPPMSDHRSYSQYLESRPDRWEVQAVELLINLCREFQTHIHVVHLATHKALRQIQGARLEGLPFTVETCPHYLYFSADQIEDGATQFKCAPPIRGAHNRDLLIDALDCELIDTIGSDHSPCPAPMKHLDSGDFVQAWGGISSLQLMLPVIWTIGQKFRWEPSNLATWLSRHPAALVGLGNRKGQLAPGYDADIVVWDPDGVTDVQADNLFHRHPLTPYEGQRLNGVVRQTYVRGKLVFDNGSHSDSPHGRLIRRGD